MPVAEPERVPVSEERSARMGRVRKTRTAPELALRRELHRRGLRYRVDHPVPGAPRRLIDVALTRARIAVFVDGCFWHGCPAHFHAPRNNALWWQWKIATVQHRDDDTVRLVTQAGWWAWRVWEHEDPREVADTLERAWRRRTGRQ